MGASQVRSGPAGPSCSRRLVKSTATGMERPHSARGRSNVRGIVLHKHRRAYHDSDTHIPGPETVPHQCHVRRGSRPAHD